MSWRERALDALQAAQLPQGGWGYAPDTGLASEPTALAGLALWAHGELEPAAAAGRALAAEQQGSGAVGIRPGFPAPAWPTSLALLLWQACGNESARGLAVDFLLARQGRHWPADPDGLVEHDTSIVGWPWITGTHSWVEPTAQAIMALTREGRREHPRVRDGLAMLRDRVVPGGGWNYGNTIVFGNALQAFPAPTGEALVALAPDLPPGQLKVSLASSSRWLAARAGSIRAPVSLAWSLLGLAACGEPQAEAEACLERSFALLERLGLRWSETALLLLAAEPSRSLPLLGMPRQPITAGARDGDGEGR